MYICYAVEGITVCETDVTRRSESGTRQFICLRFSRNSEAFASEFLEILINKCASSSNNKDRASHKLFRTFYIRYVSLLTFHGTVSIFDHDFVFTFLVDCFNIFSVAGSTLLFFFCEGFICSILIFLF